MRAPTEERINTTVQLSIKIIESLLNNHIGETTPYIQTHVTTLTVDGKGIVSNARGKTQPRHKGPAWPHEHHALETKLNYKALLKNPSNWFLTKGVRNV